MFSDSYFYVIFLPFHAKCPQVRQCLVTGSGEKKSHKLPFSLNKPKPTILPKYNSYIVRDFLKITQTPKFGPFYLAILGCISNLVFSISWEVSRQENCINGCYTWRQHEHIFTRTSKWHQIRNLEQVYKTIYSKVTTVLPRNESMQSRNFRKKKYSTFLQLDFLGEEEKMN